MASPRSLAAAACRVSARAASTSRAISASMNRSPCCSASGAPNAFRSPRYRAACSSAGPGDPDARRGDRDPALGQRRQRDPVALALPAEAVRGRDDRVLEHELGCRTGADAHLLLVGAEPEPGHALLDEERRDPARTGGRVERREDEVAVGLGRVRDPDLRAGQPVRVAVGGARARVRIAAASRAGVRLGQRERPERLAGEHRPAASVPMLLGRAPGHDRVLRQDVDRQRDRRRHVGRAELLHHERPAEVREPGPADRLGERRGGQPELAHLGEERPVEALGLVALDRARGDLTLGEFARRLLEEPLLLGEGPAQRSSSGSWGWPRGGRA